MNNPIVLSMAAAFCFGFWQPISKAGNLPAVWFALTYAIGNAAVIIAAAPIFGLGGMPLARNIAQGIFGGAINGVGMAAYAVLLMTPGIELSKYGPMTMAIMIVVTAIGGAFLGESISPGKIGCIAGIIFLIWLMNQIS